MHLLALISIGGKVEQLGDNQPATRPGFARAVYYIFAAGCCFAHPAQAANSNGEARVTLNEGVNITKNADLHFGNFAAGTTLSRFRLTPDTDTLNQLSGNAVSIGGTPTAASFSAFGSPLSAIRITVDSSNINLVRVGGSDTMRVDQFRLDGGNGTRNRTLSAAGTVNYKVGGRLTINPNQAGGAYIGSFAVTIDYQ